jgi:hypothetical protein
MIDSLLAGSRGDDVRRFVTEAARTRLAVPNLADHERAAIEAFVSASG